MKKKSRSITTILTILLLTPIGHSKMSQQELKKKLTPLQYEVTQKSGTEPPFKNEYWNNKKQGIYVDIVSGEPLFSSLDKFDSGTGWPSFTKPIEPDHVKTKSDWKLLIKRTEVRSQRADSHLGHVFNDGPAPTGKRYCINSAALRFIPKEDLEKEGYKKYLSLFSPTTSSTDAKINKTTYQEAILAGGCFWGMEELIRKQPGVIETEVGYTGGDQMAKTYNEVKKGHTGHAESVKITFDPTKTTYEKILRFFFRIHDPTTLNRQGNDVGTQYRSAIFYLNEDQKKVAEQVLKKAKESGLWKKPIVTEITKASPFFPAEEYHQDYLQKVPNGYTCHYIRPVRF